MYVPSLLRNVLLVIIGCLSGLCMAFAITIWDSNIVVPDAFISFALGFILIAWFIALSICVLSTRFSSEDANVFMPALGGTLAFVTFTLVFLVLGCTVAVYRHPARNIIEPLMRVIVVPHPWTTRTEKAVGFLFAAPPNVTVTVIWSETNGTVYDYLEI